MSKEKNYIACFGNGMSTQEFSAHTLDEAKEKAQAHASHLAGGSLQQITLIRLRKDDEFGMGWKKRYGTIDEWHRFR